MEDIKEIEECLNITKIELKNYKEIEKNMQEMYMTLVEQKEKIKTAGGKEFLEEEITKAYKTLIQHGVLIGQLEGFVNLCEKGMI